MEMITQILDCLDESDPEKPFEFDKHREMCRAMMALRLTCRSLDKIAIRHLFHTYCLSPSLRSWLNLCNIAAFERFGGHLQTLALERHNKGTYSYKAMMKATSTSPIYGFLDLSLLPKLKIVKAEDEWLITKQRRSNVEIPLGHCRIQAISFSDYKPASWRVLGDLAQITRYDFKISSLNCYSGFFGPWETLLSMDLSSLKSLRLCPSGYYSNRHKYNLWPDIELLAKLERLPNLEEFRLNQYFFGREDISASTVNLTTNVLKYLREKKWPRLRHLDLQYLTTTVADFRAFVAPHAGTLTSFHLHSGLVCPQVTEEEKLQRFYLPHWIRTIVCPRGGGTRFEHFLGQPEGFYEAPEGYEDDAKEKHCGKGREGHAEDEDIMMEDYEDDTESEFLEEDAEGDIVMIDV